MKYESLLCTELAKVANVLKPQLGGDILAENKLRRKYVTLPSNNDEEDCVLYSTLQSADGVNCMQSLINEDKLKDQ